MSFKEIEKLHDVKTKNTRHCEHCGHTITFYAFEPDKKCCNWCGRYTYRDNAAKFKDLLAKKQKELK